MNENSSQAKNLIQAQWDRFSGLPAGKWLFSRVIGFMAPYTGTIRPQVDEVRPGFARVRIRERRRLRQHLRSVHAAALFNLSELTSALALLYGLPGDARGIPIHLEIDYLKKARGLLTAEARCEVPESSTEKNHPVEIEVRDEKGDAVTRATAIWRVGPR